MANPAKILELIRNKSKRVNLAFNPQLWKLLEGCATKEGLSPTHKIEDLIIQYLAEKGKV